MYPWVWAGAASSPRAKRIDGDWDFLFGNTWFPRLTFVVNGEPHRCALVHWFSIFGHQSDPAKEMYVITPDPFCSTPIMSVIHINSICRAAHLLRMFDANPLPRTLNYTSTIDSFKGFYVNKYIHYHAYETVM